MASQEQLAQDLNTIREQVEKIGVETSATLQKVADLEAALAAAGTTTPEVDAALQALKDQINVVDGLVPDAPTP